MIPFPSEEDKAQVLFLAFDNQSWMAVGASLVILIIASWFIHNMTNDSTDSTQNPFNYWIFFIISVWTTQGITLRNSATPFRLLSGFSFLGLYLLSNYYTGTYTSLLSIPIYQSTIESVQDLVSSQTFITQTVKGSSTEEYVMQATDPAIRKIAEQIRQFPKRSLPDVFTVDDIATRVRDKQALLIPRPSGESLIQRSYEVNQKCKVTLAKKSFYSRSQSYSFPKNSSLLPTIDREILLMHQAGLIIYGLKRADWFKRNPCIISRQSSTQATVFASLKFADLSGAFVILGLGLGLAVASVLVELIAGRSCTKNKLYKTKRQRKTSSE